MKALIVEDEIYNFNGLKNLILREYPQAEIDGPVTNLVDLERAMHDQQRYDVVYCDIRLEDGVCFSVFEQLEVTVPIVFTTAYSEFSLRAFDANGIAYLLKPIGQEALRKATDKALSMNRGSQDIAAMLESIGLKAPSNHLHYLRAITYDGSYILNLADVSHFTIGERHTYAIMADGSKHRIDYTLDALMQRLDPLMFFRANRQYIVSRRAIRRIQAYGNRQAVLKLTGYADTQVLVSKEQVSALHRWIEQ